MSKKRIIPCLDVKDGKTVKGVNFEGLQEVGDISEMAARYSEDGADELVFLDITASNDNRKTRLEWVSKVADAATVPFTVGGGISSVEDAAAILARGASKVSINSSALKRPELINEISGKFGKQSLVVAIDAKLDDGKWMVYSKGGREKTGYELVAWAKEAQQRGAGEILFTSIDHDGQTSGYANDANALLSEALDIPVIASGGAGTLEDFYDAFTKGKVDAALAASVFHYGKINIKELKAYLNSKHIYDMDIKYNSDGLVPAIVQDCKTRVVLMQAYMNEESLKITRETGKACFYSRSRKRLWTKGEESGNFMIVKDILFDCDCDSILLKVEPQGPACHLGTDTCWGEENKSDNFLQYLEDFLYKRKNDSPEESYTARLIQRGINRVAQKVGEEAVEVVIEAKDNNESLFLNEAADLMYHYLVLLIAKGYHLDDVIQILKERHR